MSYSVAQGFPIPTFAVMLFFSHCDSTTAGGKKTAGQLQEDTGVQGLEKTNKHNNKNNKHTKKNPRSEKYANRPK